MGERAAAGICQKLYWRTSFLLNLTGSGIVRRPNVRTSSLLVSIAVHGAAVATVVGFGAYALQSQNRPLAHLEIRHQQASSLAPQRTLPDPDVVPEQLVEHVVVNDVRVDEQTDEQTDESADEQAIASATVDDRMLSPSEVLQGVTLERVKVPSPVPVVPAKSHEPQPAPAVVPKLSEPQVFMQAQRSDNVEPVYPARERRQMREGLVVVRIVVSTDGSVEHASLLTPSRYKGFNQSALAAARKWTFAPATRGGVAVKSETDIEVEFRLTDDR